MPGPRASNQSHRSGPCLRQSFVITSPTEFDELRTLWDSVYSPERHSLFQSFEWNRLAAQAFRSRSAPYVVAAEDERGASIIPACRTGDSLQLLGDELFDYRDFLAKGEAEVGTAAARRLAE